MPRFRSPVVRWRPYHCRRCSASGVRLWCVLPGYEIAGAWRLLCMSCAVREQTSRRAYIIDDRDILPADRQPLRSYVMVALSIGLRVPAIADGDDSIMRWLSLPACHGTPTNHAADIVETHRRREEKIGHG